MAQCARLGEIAALKAPAARYVSRLDAGLCIGLCVLYVLILLRFLTWVHRMIRRAEDTIRNAILCAIFASVGVYIILGLPALWLRNAILNRNKPALESGRKTCEANTDKKGTICTEACATIASVLANGFDPKNKPPDTTLRTLVYVLAGVLILLTVVVALHGCSLAIGVEQRSDNNNRNTRKSRAERPGNTRYDIQMLEKPSSSGDEETCVVCLSELWIRKVCQLPCKHRFHVGCIERWLSKAYRPICPLCLVEVRVKPYRSHLTSGTITDIDEDDEEDQIP